MDRLRLVSMALATLASGLVHAQDDPLAKILPGFFDRGLTLENTGHEAHFLDQGTAFAVMGEIDATLASQFATYPLSSSSGAFTTQIDPETGAEVATSDSFGPIFAERPETLGRGKVTVGATSLGYDFNNLEGFKLDQGEIVFNLVHKDTNGDGTPLSQTFEGDIIASQLFLDLRLRTNIVFANFGVTDRLDLGFAVPQVQAEMDAVVRSTILPLATGGGVHIFPGGSLVQDERVTGRASGVGDVVLRGKYDFKKGFALGFDLRLPTGDAENLLGSGATQIRILAIARGPKYDIFYGGFHPHLNLGYTYSTGGTDLTFASGAKLRIEPSDEVNYAIGFDSGLGERITLAVDLLGRVLLNSQDLSIRNQDFFYTALSGNVQKETRPEVVTTTSDVSILNGSIGVKIRTWKTLLLTMNCLVPIIRDRGLQSAFAASVGLDYTFD